MSGFGLAHIKREGAAVHPDDVDCDLSPEAYARQLAAYHEDNGMNADEFEAAELAQHQNRNGTMNTTGMQPVEYKVVILPDDVEETDERIKSAKAAGIHLIEQTSEREKTKQVKGRLIAVGGNAFQDWNGTIPQVGDRIWFAKHAGYVVPGHDGKEYRLCNDKDIAAIIEGGAK